MTIAVVDTNVLLVANGDHSDVSAECRKACVDKLMALQREGITVLDDQYRILREYRHKTAPNHPKGVGDVFLKWLLQNNANSARVHLVTINETGAETFSEFPDAALQQRFDPPDRKFVAVAYAHPQHPPIWQAADCKWLDWWQDLAQHGVRVEFLCSADAKRFYQQKFPRRRTPKVPVAMRD